MRYFLLSVIHLRLSTFVGELEYLLQCLGLTIKTSFVYEFKFQIQKLSVKKIRRSLFFIVRRYEIYLDYLTFLTVKVIFSVLSKLLINL